MRQVACDVAHWNVSQPLSLKQQQPNVTTIKEIELCSSNIKSDHFGLFTSWPSERNKCLCTCSTNVLWRICALLKFIDHIFTNRKKSLTTQIGAIHYAFRIVPFKKKMIIISFVNILYLMSGNSLNKCRLQYTTAFISIIKIVFCFTERMKKHRKWFVFAYIMSAWIKKFMASWGKTKAPLLQKVWWFSFSIIPLKARE